MSDMNKLENERRKEFLLDWFLKIILFYEDNHPEFRLAYSDEYYTTKEAIEEYFNE